MKLIALTLLTLMAFAGNSLLCRIALRGEHIDAGHFTFIRIASGALVLCTISYWRIRTLRGHGSWWSAAALFVYAAAFSLAYMSLNAGAGSLLLFGAVQTCMMVYGLYQGERLKPLQWMGLSAAIAGLVGLLLPGASAPSAQGAFAMILAGVSWGIYSLRGRGTKDATASTAGNFLLAVPMAFIFNWVIGFGAEIDQPLYDATGLACALISGALTSGLGYALWYRVLPSLTATTASIVQLSVPIIASLAAVPLLDESLSPRLVLSSIAVLGGIALVIFAKQITKPKPA
jgi:drug/metabolite transporter (DMT)-like permease